jgi:hypothetical protein
MDGPPSYRAACPERTSAAACAPAHITVGMMTTAAPRTKPRPIRPPPRVSAHDTLVAALSYVRDEM